MMLSPVAEFTVPGDSCSLIEKIGQPKFHFFQKVGFKDDYVNDEWTEDAIEYIVSGFYAHFSDRDSRYVWLYAVCTERGWQDDIIEESDLMERE